MRDKGEYLFTSESVSEGHPDKVADRISDTVLDAFLTADPYSRVACETLVTTNRVVLAGEVRGPETRHARAARRAGPRGDARISATTRTASHWQQRRRSSATCTRQSADIAQGVDSAGNKDEGAGDQGIMFGYACRRDARADAGAAALRARDPAHDRASCAMPATRAVAGLLPDAKSQVTLRYVDGKPVGATCVVVSTQHEEGWSRPRSSELLRPIVDAVLPKGWMPPEERVLREPDRQVRRSAGRTATAGLTGRKIIVDTYGGAAPHGGGAFSGKDPTKVDRSRRLCLPLPGEERRRRRAWPTAAPPDQLRDRRVHPLSVYVDLHGTGQDVDEAKLEHVLRELINLSPRGIREHCG